MADKPENKSAKGRISRLIRRIVEGYRDSVGRWWQPTPMPAPARVPVRASQPARVTRRRRY
jgi:hypothetical protein